MVQLYIDLIHLANNNSSDYKEGNEVYFIMPKNPISKHIFLNG